MYNQKGRERSQAVINPKAKKESNMNIKEEIKEETYTDVKKPHNTTSFINKDNKVIKKQRESLKTSEFDFNFEKPKFSGVKKEYYTNQKKVCIIYHS